MNPVWVGQVGIDGRGEDSKTGAARLYAGKAHVTLSLQGRLLEVLPLPACPCCFSLEGSGITDRPHVPQAP